MKVLHLLLSEALGGLELYVCSLVREQIAQGWKVWVMIIAESRIHAELRDSGAELIYGEPSRKIHFQNIQKIRQVLDIEQISLIHSHNRLDVWAASLATLFGKTRHIHSVYMLVAHKKKTPPHYLVYGTVDTFISTSELTNQAIAKNLPLARNKIRLIPYGRHLDNYEINAEKRQEIRELHQSEGKIVVGMLCRIDKQKGVREFVDSYLLLPKDLREKVVYWLIGEPTIEKSQGGETIYTEESIVAENHITKLISSQKIEQNIVRMGFQKDYISYLGSMDIFVLASYNEMYSLSLLEAMLMKVPVIGTNTGGTPEQIADEKRGLLIKPFSATEISNAVVKYIQEADLRKNCAEEAQKWASQRHDWKKTIELYKEVYEGK